MEKQEKIIEVVFQAIDKINQYLSEEEKVGKSLNEQLIGPASKLDSLGIINLIVAVEEGLQENFATTMTLANENALSTSNSPFKNVQSLVDYIQKNLQVEAHG
ncbi:MAG: hypothetical protein JNN05_03790 [Candidatus Omnitrophica bacterium]|nr:hypothetical protein [Candidatus Omnitrophota bacterium]